MRRLELDSLLTRNVDLDLLLANLDIKCKLLTHLVIESDKWTNLSLLENLSCSLKILELTVNPYICDLKLIGRFRNLSSLTVRNASSILDIDGNSDLTILSGIISLGK